MNIPNNLNWRLQFEQHGLLQEMHPHIRTHVFYLVLGELDIRALFCVKDFLQYGVDVFGLDSFLLGFLFLLFRGVDGLGGLL